MRGEAIPPSPRHYPTQTRGKGREIEQRKGPAIDKAPPVHTDRHRYQPPPTKRRKRRRIVGREHQSEEAHTQKKLLLYKCPCLAGLGLVAHSRRGTSLSVCPCIGFLFGDSKGRGQLPRSVLRGSYTSITNLGTSTISQYRLFGNVCQPMAQTWDNSHHLKVTYRKNRQMLGWGRKPDKSHFKIFCDLFWCQTRESIPECKTIRPTSNFRSRRLFLAPHTHTHTHIHTHTQTHT